MDLATRPDHEVLELDSRLEELGRTWSWVDSIADRYRIKDETRYALHLCLEEVIANVVLHGYRNEPGHRILLRVDIEPRELLLTIEDDAAPFQPEIDDTPETKNDPAELETVIPGGKGLVLIRQFSHRVAFQPKDGGNKVELAFALE